MAHSITLGLATLQIIVIPAKIIEPLIALSVIIAAINNLKPLLPYSRWLIAFALGLIHGFGFATVLTDLGLSTSQALVSLLGFNLGVEIGQLAIVLLVLPLAYIVRHNVFYRRGIFQGGSIASAMLASVWLIQRIS